MAIDKSNSLLDITGKYINRRFQEQSWFQRNANTITTAGGFVATVLAWLVSQPFASDPRVQFAVLIVGFLLTVFGVKKTPNGISASQVKKFNAERARVIGETPLVVENPVVGEDKVSEPFEVVDLDGLVADYLRLKE